MEENNTDVVDVPETPQAPEDVPETTQEPEVDSTDLQARLDESEKKRAQLYERLKKAETQTKETPRSETAADPSQLGPKDYLALQQAGITADDFDEVNDYASYRNLPISEALNDNTLKTILATKAEERKTAQATQTKSARGVKPNSGEEILKRAEEGKDLTAADVEKLAAARIARRKALRS